MLQLYHHSRSLIYTLHAYGFCALYDELRLFLSASARRDVDNLQNGIYVPDGLIPRDSHRKSGLIHEGNDNVDINVETVDGKNSYHSMTRVIFQEQSACELSRQSCLTSTSSEPDT